MQSLLDLLRDKPDLYLDEMADYIEAQFDVAVNPNTIGRKLKEARWRNKRIHHKASQQSMPLRQDWIRKVSQFTAEMYVFCDESGTRSTRRRTANGVVTERRCASTV